MVTRARFERTGFALHVGCAHGRNHKLQPHRPQFAPNFFSEAGMVDWEDGQANGEFW